MSAKEIADAFDAAVEQAAAEIMEWASGPLNGGPWQQEAYRHAVWTQGYMTKLADTFRRILQDEGHQS